MSNPYQILGVKRRADSDQIKRAYRTLARACHPDLHGGDKGAEQRFIQVQGAYETLSNPASRAVYDGRYALERTQAGARFRSAAATMFATFALTVGVGFLFANWLADAGIL